MRASPAFQVNLQHVVLWRAAVAALAVVAFASTVAWCASGTAPRSPAVWVLAISVMLLLVWAAIRAARTTALSLRWDSLNWRLGPIATVGEEPMAGQLTVLMDLGSWMLLRFVQTEPAVRRCGLRPQRYLAAQRRGLEPRWHALRCAVYSSRPAKLGLAVDETNPSAHHATTLE